jgi:hypothetical protein
MQQIYGPGLASNILLTAQKRLVRPVYAQTQGFPYATVLDPSLRDVNGNFRAPQAGDTVATSNGSPTPAAPHALSYATSTFTLSGSVVPGTVMVKSGNGEYVTPHNGVTGSAVQPFGLLDQWLGGTFDGVGQTNQCSVWQGVDSVYDLLSPAWDTTSITPQVTAQTAGLNVLLYALPNGLLGYLASPGSAVPVARAISITGAVLRIQLII